MKHRIATDAWLAAAVLVHFVVTIVHGASHDGAHVGLTRAAMLFVLLIIVIAPIAGLLVALRARRAGGAVVAVSMAAALVFGLVNHFIVISPDHVSQVVPEWRTLFSTTAVLLVLTEAAGIVAGLRGALHPVEERL
jgi:hypothetical protein